MKAIAEQAEAAETPQDVPVRRLIFISHATPQDNDFAKWLATQLAIAGYEVWCDLTELIGGERFWSDITDAIDRFAFRVLFASTLESNRKPGTLRELRLAFEAQEKHGISDFVVPLKVDQFPFEATHDSIRDLNFLRFDESWQVGLERTLALLEREGAPKSPDANAAAVSDWFRRTQDSRRRHVIRDDHCLSNWFELTLPSRLFFHAYAGKPARFQDAVASFRFPYRAHENYLATFANYLTVFEELSPGADFSESIELDTATFLASGDERLGIAAFDASNLVTGLVQQAWNQTMREKGFCSHELASGYFAWFFADGQLEKNRAHYLPEGAKKTSFRQLVGKKTKKLADGNRVPDGSWHYAVSASPQLHGIDKLCLHHHVIFTDDGRTPWASADRMHKARRSVCKQWWNAEWRDRLLAICSVLGGEEKTLVLNSGADNLMALSMEPMRFVSPWSYFEDNETGLDESQDIELVEEHTDDEADHEPA